MASAVQLFGGALGALAFVDIARRWGGPYPERLPSTIERRRELLEVGVLFALTAGAVTYPIVLFRDVLSYNPVFASIGGQTFGLVFLIGALTAVVVPAVLELGVHGRSLADLGFRRPAAWRPTLLLVGVGVLFGLAPLAFGFSGTESAAALLLGLYTPVFKEELLFRGVLQTKLERVVTQERAWIISGVLFGLSHVPNDFFGFFWVADGGDPIIALGRLAQQTAKGLLYGLLFMKSRTLAAPIVAHYCSNKLALVVNSIWG
jgi:membrane protease YdiL (CAAX protease family)